MQNMNVELVAQMFKNYQSNVLFHLEGWCKLPRPYCYLCPDNVSSYGQPEGTFMSFCGHAIMMQRATSYDDTPAVIQVA